MIGPDKLHTLVAGGHGCEHRPHVETVLDDQLGVVGRHLPDKATHRSGVDIVDGAHIVAVFYLRALLERVGERARCPGRRYVARVPATQHLTAAQCAGDAAAIVREAAGDGSGEITVMDVGRTVEFYGDSGDTAKLHVVLVRGEGDDVDRAAATLHLTVVLTNHTSGIGGRCYGA